MVALFCWQNKEFISEYRIYKKKVKAFWKKVRKHLIFYIIFKQDWDQYLEAF